MNPPACPFPSSQFRSRKTFTFTGTPYFLSVISYLLILASPLFAQDSGSKSRVAYLENPNLLDNYDPKPDPVKTAFASLLTTLTGKEKPADAWKDLGLSPDDTVAVKVSALGDPRTSTSQAVVNAVTDSLTDFGIKSDNIVVWDRLERDLSRSGFNVSDTKGQIQTRAVIASDGSATPGIGWDADTPPFFSPLMGELIFGDLKFRPGLPSALATSKGTGSDRTPYWSYYAKILTQPGTKVVNLGSMTSDPQLGIYGCCASLALGSIDNTRRFLKPANPDQDTTIGEILISDPLKPKTILHISDGLVVKFAGKRTKFDANYAATPGILVASKDPVALDAMALDRFEQLRANPGSGAPPISKIGNVPHIAGAALVGAGNADPTKIEIVNVK